MGEAVVSGWLFFRYLVIGGKLGAIRPLHMFEWYTFWQKCTALSLATGFPVALFVLTFCCSQHALSLPILFDVDWKRYTYMLLNSFLLLESSGLDIFTQCTSIFLLGISVCFVTSKHIALL